MSITVKITDGPTTKVTWKSGMNAQKALEEAYYNKPVAFNFGLQYFGSMGYFVSMINETYDSFMAVSSPYYYWEFSINGDVASIGVDLVILNDGDVVEFDYQVYSPELDPKSTMHRKHILRSK